MDFKRIEEAKNKMPQIWLKRRLYDGLTKRGINVEEKVDELVGNFLNVLKEEYRGEKNG